MNWYVGTNGDLVERVRDVRPQEPYLAGAVEVGQLRAVANHVEELREDGPLTLAGQGVNVRPAKVPADAVLERAARLGIGDQGQPVERGGVPDPTATVRSCHERTREAHPFKTVRPNSSAHTMGSSPADR